MKHLRDIISENEHEDMHFAKGQKTIQPSLNGVDFKSYKPPKDWSNVSGQDHSIKEPPIHNPHGLNVSTGLVMHEPDGRVWLAKPANAYGGYKHTFPKGGLEKGLHPQANAIKEAYEETGLKGRITGHAGDAEGTTSITRYYHATREAGDPREHGWESEGVVLAHPDNLHKYLNMPRDKKFAREKLGAKT